MAHVAIAGYLGNMGMRYRAILDHLGHQWRGIDLETTEDEVYRILSWCDAVIIATPTYSHAKHIHMYSRLEVPILCEKPISRDWAELVDIVEYCEKENVNLSMVNQYKFLAGTDIAPTYYGYYRTGHDGLAWDCINIIGLARSEVHLSNRSPIWTCSINGQAISIAKMDEAYIKMIGGWLTFPVPGLDYIRRAHARVHEIIEFNGGIAGGTNASIDWDPSKEYKSEASREVL